jgi:hypothetical protein
MHTVKASTQRLIDSFNTFAPQAKRVGSDGDRQVTLQEMNTGIGILETNGPVAESFEKMNALIRKFGKADLAPEARARFYEVVGIAPPDPVLPPIVALYSVTINDAVRDAGPGDLNRLRALRVLAEVALEPHGGTSGRRRGMTVETMSLATASLAGVEAEHQPNKVRAAVKNLDAKIAELAG